VLRRAPGIRTSLTAGLALCLWGIPATALAGHKPLAPPVVVTTDNHQGEVTTRLTAPGSPGQKIVRTVSTGGGQSKCTWQVIFFVARLPLSSSVPGTWYGEFCGGPDYQAVVFVPNRANNRPLVQQTPATLALQQVSRLPLPTPAVRHNPSGDALVNLATWWWVDPRQWRPLTQRTAAGPVWARVTARPVRSVWDAGDGSAPLTCGGGGTPYDASEQASAQSTACSHTYGESIAGQPQTGPDPNDRFFTVTVTVYWQVRFVGSGGAGGALPVMTRTSRFPLRVDERQTVVTGGSG
jgi:hypothetical protein